MLRAGVAPRATSVRGGLEALNPREDRQHPTLTTVVIFCDAKRNFPAPMPPSFEIFAHSVVQVYAIVDEAAHAAAGGLPVVRVAQALIKAPVEDVATCWWQVGKRKVRVDGSRST